MIILHVCPTCGAKEDQPCRTPKGRIKPTVHDTRPFSVAFEPDNDNGAEKTAGGGS